MQTKRQLLNGQLKLHSILNNLFTWKTTFLVPMLGDCAKTQSRNVEARVNLA